MTPPAIAIPHEELAALCRKWHIRKLSLFGSVLRADFGPDSDVDVLVEFEPGHVPGRNITSLENDLSGVFGGRSVDVVLPSELNRWIKKRVLNSAQLWYDADCGGIVLDVYEGVRGDDRSVEVVTKDDLVYFGLMLDDAREIRQFVAGLEREDFDNNRMLRLALERLEQNIGESASKVSLEGRQSHPELPWDEIIGMRHRLVHDYPRIRADFVWDTAKNSIPELIIALEQFMPPAPSDETM